MKKIFTLAAAVLASVSLMAAEPTLAINTESQGTEDFVKAYEAEGITLSSTASFGNGAVQLGNTPSSYGQHYFEVLAGSAEIDSISFLISGNGSNKNIQAPLFGWAETATSNTADTYVLLDPKVVTANSYAAAQWFTYDLSKAEVKCARIYRTTKNVSSVNPEYTGSSTALGTGQTIKIYGLKVWLKETKTIVSTEETLTGAAINDVALSELQMATLNSALSLDLTNEYAEAPTVTFTVQTDTYYVGEETPSTKSEDIDVVAALNPDGKWQAQQTIGEQTYTITAVKPATATVTYMDGETVLGTETVKVGESATKHGEYEVKPLAEFQGWYTDAELTSEANLSAIVGADMILYAKFVKAYATSLNIEQYILDNGRNNADQDHIGEAFAAVLSGAGYAYSNLNALDTLNDLENKENRNYAFLGLKMKTAGASIQFNLQAGKTLAVKFGNLPKPIAVTIDGVAQANHTEGAFLLEAAEADRLIELKTTDKSTVVLQQIMIGEAIADVTLPDPGAYAITLSAENGTLEAAWEGKTEKKVNVPVGETVTLTVTPAEGYKLETITVNEVALEAVEGVYSFTMPAQAANVVATFVAESATGINNAEEAVKAVKVIRNGQLFIEKNGVLFNAQGAVVK